MKLCFENIKNYSKINLNWNMISDFFYIMKLTFLKVSFNGFSTDML